MTALAFLAGALLPLAWPVIYTGLVIVAMVCGRRFA
jgi:hypothetical protein